MEYFQHSLNIFQWVSSEVNNTIIVYDIIHSQIMLDSNKQITSPLTSIAFNIFKLNKAILWKLVLKITL